MHSKLFIQLSLLRITRNKNSILLINSIRPKCTYLPNYFSNLFKNTKGFTVQFQNQNLYLADSYFKTRKMSSTMLPINQRLVWIDLEMTGLDADKERIMEAAVIVTEGDLGIIKEGPNIIIKVEDKILDNMNDWCKSHHGDSGLTEGCRKSEITLGMAEDQILEFIIQHTEPGKSPLAGNSIHADKKFLDKYMPKLMKHLHYRIVDVSTVKELCSRWYPEILAKAPPKKATHRALEDIKESIRELAYFKDAIFK